MRAAGERDGDEVVDAVDSHLHAVEERGAVVQLHGRIRLALHADVDVITGQHGAVDGREDLDPRAAQQRAVSLLFTRRRSPRRRHGHVACIRRGRPACGEPQGDGSRGGAREVPAQPAAGAVLGGHRIGSRRVPQLHGACDQAPAGAQAVAHIGPARRRRLECELELGARHHAVGGRYASEGRRDPGALGGGPQRIVDHGADGESRRPQLEGRRGGIANAPRPRRPGQDPHVLSRTIGHRDRRVAELRVAHHGRVGHEYHRRIRQRSERELRTQGQAGRIANRDVVAQDRSRGERRPVGLRRVRVDRRRDETEIDALAQLGDARRHRHHAEVDPGRRPAARLDDLDVPVRQPVLL